MTQLKSLIEKLIKAAAWAHDGDVVRDLNENLSSGGWGILNAALDYKAKEGEKK